jgi:hypothetical protein
MTFLGHVQNGVVVFETPIPIPEGTAVTVSPQATPPSEERREVDETGSSPPPVRWFDGLVGCLDLPKDASQNVDHYLYGHPKVTDTAKPS